jgi:glucokinase
MSFPSIVTLDIGGTKINAGRYVNGVIEQSHSYEFCATSSSDDIERFIIHCIDAFLLQSTVGIAIGVPCIVDTQLGVVYDAVNIPAWQEFNLKGRLEAHFKLEVYVNNDVNCFTVGEHLFGAGKGYDDIVGLCLGTGVGAGFIIQNQLYQGHNCSAGEVGEVQYLNSSIDDYCSGRFFEIKYGINGATLAQHARAGNKEAIDAFEQFGLHLAQAISYLLLIIDPQVIVIGGSVSHSFDLFIEGVRQGLSKFSYQKVARNLVIVQSNQSDSALLGAAQLHLESVR